MLMGARSSDRMANAPGEFGGMARCHVSTRVSVEAGTRDGWSAAEISMKAVPIVVMEPARKMGGAFFRGVIGATVGPLRQRVWIKRSALPLVCGV